MKNSKNLFVLIIVIGIIVFGVTFVGMSLTENIGKTDNEISTEKGMVKLSKLMKNINVTNVEAKKANVEITSENLADELPDISKYPLGVEGKGEINVEIFSSPEKAGSGTDGWMIEVAKKFNAQNKTIDGKKVSVSVRNISSGLAVDYIVSGKYVPDAFSPSNELWGEMIKQSTDNITMVNNRLVGNVPGILIEKNKYKEFVAKYGAVNMDTITNATINNELALGYTNPFASSTGMNFLVSALSTFDSSNPLSEEAIKKFQSFQENIPFVSYNTMQMREAADTGSLDAFIMEYQTYKNDTELYSKYEFTPFGVRHDNPLYSLGDLSSEKVEALKMFTEFAKNQDTQGIASKYGFNELDNYVSETQTVTGDVLVKAQKIWKEEKDSGKPVVAVFVADISGSMAGEPINQLKKSLINASQYIDSNNSIGLVSYNSNVYINLPIKQFDLNQRAYFTGAVQSLDASGGTATFNAMTTALNMLMEAKANTPDAKLMMFLLSDGETNTGYNLSDVQDVLTALEIPVYTIGYNANITALQSISNINEAASINADSDDVIYQLKNLFNSQM